MSDIPGVVWELRKTHADKRGSMTEAIRACWVRDVVYPSDAQIVQVNVSKSKVRTLRGLHLHEYQWDFWYLADGVMQVLLYDFATDRTVDHDIGEGWSVAIPPGVAHGFLALTDVTLIYAVTREFDHEKPDEHTICYRQFADRWRMPMDEVIVSKRDSGACLP